MRIQTISIIMKYRLRPEVRRLTSHSHHQLIKLEISPIKHSFEARAMKLKGLFALMLKTLESESARRASRNSLNHLRKQTRIYPRSSAEQESDFGSAKVS